MESRHRRGGLCQIFPKLPQYKQHLANPRCCVWLLTSNQALSRRASWALPRSEADSRRRVVYWYAVSFLGMLNRSTSSDSLLFVRICRSRTVWRQRAVPWIRGRWSTSHPPPNIRCRITTFSFLSWGVCGALHHPETDFIQCSDRCVQFHACEPRSPWIPSCTLGQSYKRNVIFFCFWHTSALQRDV